MLIIGLCNKFWHQQLVKPIVAIFDYPYMKTAVYYNSYEHGTFTFHIFISYFNIKILKTI